MSKEIVLDIETIGDIRNFDSLKITVVSIYQYENDSYRSFEESELNQLWPILEKAERIIGYNSEHFDLPILNKYYMGNLMTIPQLDLLKVIKEMSGSRYKLNDIAKATLQIEKSADGLQAMKWFEEGKIDEIKKYCEQDVKVTKELYEYGRNNRMLYYNTLTGELMPIAVNFDQIKLPGNQNSASSGVNMTLPF
ncbi:MAG: hypothetical protein A2469_01860 [Candidatus Magasanikbacteria bacterium RIFOXYC2_FULL_40_16]|uniref:YprB ribonuclease H-like domain-containing protein n=3 Tax=Candidatus Magasanikiibacteriota TaxID=1752731 RepID=A0A1F6NJR5_9BACT|nr:MAG: hypothetical protein A2224_01830 [Candidatus Magasanikbacteria bacterium RIFOXYA2_FULL_40_20]OGH84000.1 MAG: hypothetical protein A2373_01360 [Candidatus Magasanikbacteria bacterium RIFOXYB1_FULL_40_15]OGH85542.1 MAG: hypothetical protein A2301_01945 [Candidatus Magasanikbacteria bacterium RIFOXYB2_FULL_40_13]OGH87962.1 MAG: hypothetical protein A2206_01465 [Candidatus Magasanikbacteria bacterium RIFOXYA1_FULL_40_8]OGH90115.1 MAG: hypothetical protein A2469_01860 [Candidatus Magasanikba